MGALEVIEQALSQQVILYLKDDTLAFKAKNGLSPQLREKIVANKSQIIEYLRSAQQTKAQSSLKLPPMGLRPEGVKPQLSFAQQRLWFVDKFEGSSAQYNIPWHFELTGKLDINAFNRALDTIVERHESLRTVFSELDGEVYQQVNPAQSVAVDMIELTSLTHSEAKAKVMEIANTDAATPFDLQQDLMIRASVVKLSEQSSVVLLNMHHIASDGWSKELLTKELLTLYRAYLHGQDNPLEALTIQYADYAHWQRQWLKGDALDKLQSYWQDQLEGIPQVHSLILDRPRPEFLSSNGQQLRTSIDADIAHKAKDYCTANDITLFMLLESTFAALLSRFTSETDIVIGTPVAGREDKALENLIGFFVNTVPLRNLINPEQRFDEYLQHNKKAIVGAFEHQHMPFEMLVESLAVKRNTSHSPIFQIAFKLAHAKEFSGDVGDKKGVDLGAKFEIELSAVELKDKIGLIWHYNCDLFDQQSIENLNRGLSSMLSAAMENPQARINQLPVISKGQADELAQIACRDLSQSTIESLRVDELFEKQVNKTPDAIALVDGDSKLSYQTLNQQANQLAHYLVSQGVNHGDLVGICVGRSYHAVVAMLAVVKAGAAYVPMDPDYPEQRLAHIISDAAVKLLLCDSELTDTALYQGQVVAMDDQTLLQGQSQDNLALESIAADSSLYVIYTSGSTGQPKGVVIEHRSVAALVRQTNYVQIESQDVFAIASNIAFDAATFEIWGSLLNGASGVMLDKPTLIEPNKLANCIKINQINTLFVTTAVLNQVAQQCPDAFAPLKQLLFGGEQVNLPAVQSIFAAGKPQRVLHVYGPTECTTYSSWFEVSTNDLNGQTLPIGQGLTGTSLYVLNEALEMVPNGAIGELYIGGNGLAKGYLNQAQMTERSFVDNPYQPGTRLYKTGDLVSRDHTGNLVFIARADQQVKIRGFRIEPLEIEVQLIACQQVSEGCVLVHSNDQGQKSLVAYLTLNQTDDSVAAVREQMSRHLPDYMVPSAYVVLDKLPITANGKINKKALPEPSENDLVKSEYIAPQNPLQQQIVDVFVKVLKLEKVSIKDNFFSLGGHSLLATKVLSLLNQQQNRQQITLKQFFANATVAQLSVLLSHNLGSDKAVPVVKHASREGLPASFAQQRLWLLDTLEGTSTQYNMPGRFDLAGTLDVDAFEKALTVMVERHEVLRTNIIKGEDDLPVQTISQNVKVRARYIDLRPQDEDKKRQSLAQWASQQGNEPFDLANDLMLRCCLLHLSDTHTVVLLTLHHIAADGGSMAIISSELSVLYRAFAQGDSNPLPALEYQYGDYAKWQRELLDSETLSRHQDFWQDRLADMPQLHSLPLDKPRGVKQTFEGAAFRTIINPELSHKVATFCHNHEITEFMLLQTAFAVLLGRFSHNDDIVVGTPVDGRDKAEFSNLVGFFVNTLVLRTQIQPQQSFIELLSDNKTNILAAFEHRNMPFEQLVEQLNDSRDGAYSPLFQILFSMQSFDDELADSRSLEDNGLRKQKVKFDLELSVRKIKGQLALTWAYNSALFNTDSIDTMAQSFGVLLDAMLSNAQLPLAQLPIICGDETRRTLAASEGHRREYPAHLCIHQLFEHQAANQPGAIAVTFDGKQLSYGKLNQQANQLANQLRAQGVTPDTLVGLCLERSFDMVIGILAIHKAGGGYVPLEPGYPAARLAYMIEDANIQVVLTHHAHHSALSEGLGESKVELLSLDDGELTARLAQLPSDNLQVAGLDSSKLAYAIYTSGSTGKPKGVIVEHKALVNRIHWMQNQYRLSTSDTVLQKTPFSFDVSVWEFVWTLGYGARLAVAKPEGHKDPHYLRSLIAEQNVTVLHFVPSMLSAYMTHCDNRMPNVVRKIFCSGEALGINEVKRLSDNCPDVAVHNLYGPTEAAIDVSFFDCKHFKGGMSVPIGKAIQNTRLLVLDDGLNCLPQGAIGQLYIGGDGLARGYLNRPELTAERFIDDPFNPGCKLYKTGDLVRYLDDGNLQYLGRIDHQVKLRGLRIEIDEIAFELSHLVGVVDAYVMMQQNHRAEDELAGYVILNDDCDADEFNSRWREQLSAQLPAFMVPSAIAIVEAWPLTANGKLDRKALPVPEYAKIAGFVEPTGVKEQLLAEIWANLLECEVQSISSNDSFFALGGHSLLLIKLRSMLAEHGYDLDFTVLYGAGSLAKQAAELIETSIVQAPLAKVPDGCDKLQSDMFAMVALDAEQLSAIEQQIPGGAGNIKDIYPLSPLQQGMLYHALAEPEDDPYILTSLYRCQDDYDFGRFVAAMSFVIERHDALRTRIVVDGVDEPVQVVCREAELPVRYIETQVPPGHEIAYLRQFKLPADEGLCLSDAPLMRLYVLVAEGVHYVLMCHHHLIEDNLSLRVMRTEIHAHMAKWHHTLPEPVQFGAFIWHGLQVDDSEAQNYFKHYLADLGEVAAPMGIRDMSDKNITTNTYKGVFAQELTVQLEQLAERFEVSLSTVLHLAYGLVLKSVAGQSDVVFGTVLSGRMKAIAGIESMVGMCINTLPVRLQSSKQGIGEALKQLHGELLALLKYEQMPLNRIKSLIGTGQNMPLFACVLNCRLQRDRFGQNEAKRQQNDNSAVKSLGEKEHANYPLSCSIDYVGEGLSVTLESHSAIVPDEIFSAINQTLQSLCQLALAQDSDIAQVQVLESWQQNLLLEQLDNTGGDYPNVTLAQAFEQQVANNGEATAIVDGERSISYNELNAAANRLANYLSTQQLAHGEKIGLCLAKSTEMIVTMLAIVKAGCAYVPIDPDYPSERIEHMLSDSQLSFVLVDQSVAQVDFAGAKVINFDDAASEAAAVSCRADNPAIKGSKPSDLAYVIYTSGSTGKPKGVQIEQNSVVSLVVNTDYVQITAENCIAIASNVAFDAATFEIWGALLNGATGVIVNRETLLGIDALAHTIATHKIDTMFVTTALFNQVAQARPALFAPLKQLLFGGEKVNMEAVAKVFELGKPERLLHVYGPTECTTFSTWYEVKAEDISKNNLPIGKGLSNTELVVLDENQHLVPAGSVGELYIGGDGLARGYLNQATLTQQQFVPHPYKPDTLLYRSGDLVRRLGDGNLLFVSRVDNQVKLRGFRIELAEVESQLLAVDGIAGACVSLYQHEQGQQHLVAYVAASDNRLNASILSDRLKQSLPAFMLPSSITFMDQLPLTANGKIDKAALPAPQFADSNEKYVAPRTATEQQLCQIWQQLLKVERVGIDDNFFALGGDSIISIQVVTRAKRAGISLSVNQLFDNQSIRALAEVAGTGAQIQAEQTSVAGEMPLLPIQAEFFAQKMPQQNHFNQAVLLNTPAEFDEKALHAIFAALVERHDVLRMTFSPDSKGWIGQFDTEHQLANHLARFSVTDSNAIRPLCDELQSSLDIVKGPIFKAAYFDLGDDKPGRLLITCHHLVIDGVSWRVLLSDLETAYQQLSEGQQITLAEKTSSFKQWSEALLKYSQSSELNDERQYWHQMLARQTPLPEALARTGEKSERGALSLSLNVDDTTTLLGPCKNYYKGQINELLLAALVKAWQQFSGQSQLRLKMEGHGREALFEHLDTSETLGWFTSAYPLVLSHGEQSDIDSVVKTVKQQYRGLPQNGIGFGVLKYLAKDPEICRLEQQFDGANVVFNYLGQFDNTLKQQSLFARATESAGQMQSPLQQNSEFLTINGQVHGGKLAFSFNFNTAQLSKAQVEGLAEHFHHCLTDMVSRAKQGNGKASKALSVSDFNGAELNESQLEQLMTRYPNMEQVYLTTPMQRLILQNGPKDCSNNAYNTLTWFDLNGELNIAAFKGAWQQLVDSHSILRSCFAPIDGGQIHQVVMTQSQVDFEFNDWREISEPTQQLQQFKAQQKHLGFDRANGPLMRLRLLQLEDNRYHLVWTHHHTLLDGWCLSILFDQLMMHYQRLAQGKDARLSVSADFADYLVWLKQQDTDAAEAFWRDYLTGAKAVDFGQKAIADDDALGYDSLTLKLSKDQTQRLEDKAKSLQVTLNALVQLAWAGTLKLSSGSSDVVFGTTISGRPEGLKDVDKMVGLFINVVPARLALSGDTPLEQVLAELNRSNAQRQGYGYADVNALVDNAEGLYDSLLVFENYPEVGGQRQATGATPQSKPAQRLAVSGVGGSDQTHFPLTLVAFNRDVLQVTFSYRKAAFRDEQVAQLLKRFEAMLGALTRADEQMPVGQLSIR